MTPAIQTLSLSRKFGRTVALDRVDLEVPEGAVYALVGANGAGKTTLIKVLMNIFQPTGGAATVLGIDSHKVSGKAFNRIGYVSENQQMPDWMTVGDMLAYFRNFYPQWDRDLEQQLLRQFDLPLKRKLKHLSRGMRMKAAFASSLAYRPALIVLDEPFSGLDPLVRDELIEGLIDRAPETTIFLSSQATWDSWSKVICSSLKNCPRSPADFAMSPLPSPAPQLFRQLRRPVGFKLRQPIPWSGLFIAITRAPLLLRSSHASFLRRATSR
jgi:ABC-type multidrug transport system ATPase subunit